jgi:hypothetical protein
MKISGRTSNPDEKWILQAGQNLMDLVGNRIAIGRSFY